MIADAATMEQINHTISKAKNDVKELIKQAHEAIGSGGRTHNDGVI